jgi:hypothetical protein
MVLIVEDGSGLPDAESFASVAQADARVLAHAAPAVVTAWLALTEAAKENKLRQGAEFLRSWFYSEWKGLPATSGQGLPWPRLEAYDERGTPIGYDSVPLLVVNANIDLAAAAAANPSLPLGGSVAPTNGAVLEEEVTVGPITRRKVYAPGQAANTVGYPGQGAASGILPAVRQMLAPVLDGIGTGRVHRV